MTLSGAVNGERRYRRPEYTPTAAEFVRQVARRWGDRRLVINGDRCLSYAEAQRRSERLARALLAEGVGRASRVGLLAPNRPEWVVAWLAVARIGAVAVLLNTFHKAQELGRVLAHSRCEVLLTVDRYLNNDYVSRLGEAVPGLVDQKHRFVDVHSHPSLRAVWMWTDQAPRWAGSIANLQSRAVEVSLAELAQAEADVASSDPMVVLYSSGSAAEPKGVIHSQATVIVHPFNLNAFRDLAAGDVLYTPMPLFWVGGLSYTLVSAMHVGATVVFEDRFEPGAVLDLIESHRVTHVIGWPHTAKALLGHPSFGGRDLSSIRGGSFDELLPEHLRVGDPARRATSLGMTETLGPHSIEMMGMQLPLGKEGSFGRSVPGMQHRIVDPVTGAELPTGQIGEIWVRGYSLMLGLLDRRDDAVFEPGGWYRTGDSGYLDPDGHLYFEGRLGTMIKTAGMNVVPREVEQAIEAEPGVRLAVVVGVGDVDRGEAVTAAVVTERGVDFDPDDLRRRLKAEISGYKVPRHVAVFDDVGDLPWLESGKIDLRALRRLLVDRFGS